MDICQSSPIPADVPNHLTSRSKDYKFDALYSNMEKIRFKFITIKQLIKTLNQEVHDKLRHPQWKHFKHMEVCDSDRVRISNIIWRSWHIKFQQNSFHSFRSIPFLDFTIPDLDTTHKQSESVVLEGQYWCRKNVRVALEYSNWRQEFRKNRRYNVLSNESSGMHTFEPILESHSDTICPFSDASNILDFPIFTQNEIDELVMLDMHDTLFTSNPVHMFSTNHFSDIDYPPQNQGIPSHLAYNNIQPALDHLHPFYQGFCDTFCAEDVHSDGSHSNNVYPTFVSNLPSLPHEFPPNDILHSSGDEKCFLANSNCSLYKFDTLLKTSSNRLWNKECLSQGYHSYDELTESYQPHMLTVSPKELKSPINNLDLGHENIGNSNIQSTMKDIELSKLLNGMEGRLLHLEQQVTLHQGLFHPFMDNFSKSSPKSTSTVDSISSVPSPKRICMNSNRKSPNIIDVPRSSPILGTQLQIPSTPIRSTSVFPKSSSDLKRRFGMKSLLEQLESKLPKQNINGAKLSNASLLLKAGDFARDLQNQIHVIEKEVSELESNIDVKRKSNSSINFESIYRSHPAISESSNRFEDYIKERSIKDPKYDIFSTLMRPFFKQFTNTYNISSKYQFFEGLKEFSSKSLTVPSMETYIADTLSQVQDQIQISTKPENIIPNLANI